MANTDGYCRGLPAKNFTLLTEHNRQTLEICLLTSEINPLWEPALIQRRLTRLIDGYQSLIEFCEDEQDKFEMLAAYFFMRQGFRIKPFADLQLRDCLLPYVLSRKEGPAELLLILFIAIAKSVGIKIQCLSKRGNYLFKICINGRTQIVDFSRECRFLEPFEIVDLVNQGIDFANPVSEENSLIRYLYLITKLARKELNLHALTLAHSYLMRHQPFNLRHVSERAKLAYLSGNFRSAIDDIRDYFVYKSEEVTNKQLKRIYKLALKKEKDLDV